MEQNEQEEKQREKQVLSINVPIGVCLELAHIAIAKNQKQVRLFASTNRRKTDAEPKFKNLKTGVSVWVGKESDFPNTSKPDEEHV